MANVAYIAGTPRGGADPSPHGPRMASSRLELEATKAANDSPGALSEDDDTKLCTSQIAKDSK